MGRRENRHKLYIDISLTNTAEGEKRLNSFSVDGGFTSYEIDKHMPPLPSHSRKAGGSGMMYRCRVRGAYIDIYHEILDDDYVDYWYVAREQAEGLPGEGSPSFE